MFQIPAAPRGIPMAWQGHFYARRGESLVALDMSKYEEIRRQTVNEDWTAEVVADATIDDLDKEASQRLVKVISSVILHSQRNVTVGKTKFFLTRQD